MNYWLTAAAILSLAAFAAHTFMGDAELRQIHPRKLAEAPAPRQKLLWVMFRNGWHMVSWDLLLTSAVLIAELTGLYHFSADVWRLLCAYYWGYAVFWCISTLLSTRRPKVFVLLPQWLLLGVIGACIFMGRCVT
jgi:hypothetical protein